MKKEIIITDSDLTDIFSKLALYKNIDPISYLKDYIKRYIVLNYRDVESEIEKNPRRFTITEYEKLKPLINRIEKDLLIEGSLEKIDLKRVFKGI